MPPGLAILDLPHVRAAIVVLPGPLSPLASVLGAIPSLGSVSTETLLVLATYAVLGAGYLVVVPLALYWWMNRRWTAMGKIERTAVYGLVFLFFPGLIRVGQGER